MEEAARMRDTDKIEPLAKAAHYDSVRNALTVELKSGATFSLPRRMLPKPFSARRTNLERITIDPPGVGIWFDSIDEGLLVAGLIDALVGLDWLRYRGAALAGSVRSEKKADAARRNGASGGRPRKVSA
jgi:hypothetical protein